MATFETLAAKCAVGVALDLLVAIASVESGVHPLAVRDGTTLTHATSAGEGVAFAVGAADQGREVRVGLMGLTEPQLRAAGLTLTEGFDACASLTAAAGIVAAARTATPPQSADAADRSAIRVWWRADGRFGSVAAFETAVARARTSAAIMAKREVTPTSSKAVETANGTSAPAKSTSEQAISPASEPDCWNVFARQRAGFAQCEDPAHVARATHDQRVRSQQPATAPVVIFGSRATPR